MRRQFFLGRIHNREVALSGYTETIRTHRRVRLIGEVGNLKQFRNMQVVSPLVSGKMDADAPLTGLLHVEAAQPLREFGCDVLREALRVSEVVSSVRLRPEPIYRRP